MLQCIYKGSCLSLDQRLHQTHYELKASNWNRRFALPDLEVIC